MAKDNDNTITENDDHNITGGQHTSATERVAIILGLLWVLVALGIVWSGHFF